MDNRFFSYVHKQSFFLVIEADSSFIPLPSKGIGFIKISLHTFLNYLLREILKTRIKFNPKYAEYLALDAPCSITASEFLHIGDTDTVEIADDRMF